MHNNQTKNYSTMFQSLTTTRLANIARRPITLSLVTMLLLALTATNANAFTDGSDRTLTRFGEFGEWTLSNTSFGGNPYDLQATATFVHADSGERRSTPMYYAGDGLWKFRFTATRIGRWTFSTASSDADLNGFSGSVTVNGNSPYKGFVESNGSFWTRSANGQAFVPQFVMYGGPQYFRTNSGLIQTDINRYLDNGFGFTGYHVPVYCRWFDIDTARCSEVNLAAQCIFGPGATQAGSKTQRCCVLKVALTDRQICACSATLQHVWALYLVGPWATAMTCLSGLTVAN